MSRLVARHGEASTGPSPRAEAPSPAAVPLFPKGSADPQGQRLRRPRFPKNPPQTLQLRDQLGPHRDHPKEQPDRRQSGCFLNKNPQHDHLPAPERKGNIVLFLFSGKWRVVGQFEN